MTKTDVRRIAADLGLRTADKPESMDICFVGLGDYRGSCGRPHLTRLVPGPIVDTTGEVVGSHQGSQTSPSASAGLGVAVGDPLRGRHRPGSGHRRHRAALAI